ncbi:ankyrin repeat-containing domain protein, partial [Hypoxylon sp. FL1857]
MPYIDVHWMTSSCRLDYWRSFLVDYLAYQSWVEREPKSLRGRIRRAAVNMSEQVGNTDPTTIKACLKSLCLISLSNGDWHSHKHALFFPPMEPWPPECTDEELERDLCIAAIYLGHYSYIEKLIFQGCHFCSWEMISSEIFGKPIGAAIFKGDVSMLRLLISSNPKYEQSVPLDSTLQQEVLRRAAILGHRDIFDFALDGRPIDLVAGECEDSSRHPEYESLRDAIASTPCPEIYERGAFMFTSKSKIFDPRGRGSLIARLTEKAAAGQVDMVQYFLSRVNFGEWPNQEARTHILKCGYSKYQPLLAAVKSGNPDVVKLLLDHGADPNQFPVFHTALMCAVRFSRLKMAKMLLETGVKVNEGCPPAIVLAVFKEDMDMFHLLRQYGARLDTPETGNWAMAVAQFYELESMVDVLVQEGVERGAILHRCAEREEVYQPDYLFPQCGLDEEEVWLRGMDEDDDGYYATFHT